MSPLRTALRRLRVSLANAQRRRRFVPPYVYLDLEGEFVDLAEPPPTLPFARLFRRFLPAPAGPRTVLAFRRQLERLIADPRVQGVVLHINCTASAATYQSLRAEVLRFRAAGKRAVAYAESLGPFQYYLACACNQIIMPPSAELNILGLCDEYAFLKEALDRLGISAEVVNVSPFKSAGDPFTRTDFSEASREQAEWLLEARFSELVRGIAEGRSLSETRVRELIDQAPFNARQAVEVGLIDAALYEDEIEGFLQAQPPLPRQSLLGQLFKLALRRLAPETSAELEERLRRERRGLARFDEVSRALLITQPRLSDKAIGIVCLRGLIVSGSSRRLPLPGFGDAVAGSQDIIAALRTAERDDRIAAVVLYVDSRGGSALASDLIARAVRRLNERKPVVVYMGGAAASGGYYVSALARCIVAQPLTITGSIGVITLILNTERALGQLGIRRRALKRGQRADLFSDLAPLTEERRAVFASLVQRSYDDFKRIVAEGRKQKQEDLEPICGGRVWTGAQAHARGLVDVLGDARDAVERARALGGLPADREPRLVYLSTNQTSLLPVSLGSALHWLRDQIRREHVWALLPWTEPSLS